MNKVSGKTNTKKHMFKAMEAIAYFMSRLFNTPFVLFFDLNKTNTVIDVEMNIIINGIIVE
jgi:hypothetical protein